MGKRQSDKLREEIRRRYEDEFGADAKKGTQKKGFQFSPRLTPEQVQEEIAKFDRPEEPGEETLLAEEYPKKQLPETKLSAEEEIAFQKWKKALPGELNEEGDAYDLRGAWKSKAPIKDGHLPSRDPKTGLLLKYPNHPSWEQLVEAEKEAGYEIVFDEKTNRYYSKKAQEGQIAQQKQTPSPTDSADRSGSRNPFAEEPPPDEFAAEEHIAEVKEEEERASRIKDIKQYARGVLANVEEQLNVKDLEYGERRPVSPRHGVAQKDAEHMKLERAKELLTHVINAPDDDDRSITDLWRKGFQGWKAGGGITSALPGVGEIKALSDQGMLKNAAEKHLANKATGTDDLLLQATGLDQLGKEVRAENQNIWDNITDFYAMGEMAPTMMRYMGEYVMTRGAYSTARAGVAKAIPNAPTWVKNSLGSILGVTAQTAANPQMVAVELSRRLTPGIKATLSTAEDFEEFFGIEKGTSEFKDSLVVQAAPVEESFGEAFAKAFGTSATELLTERFGEWGARALKGVKGGIADKSEELLKRVTFGKLIDRFLKGTKNIRAASAKGREYLSKAGWNGVITEVWVEEWPNAWLANVITQDTDWDKMWYKDEDGEVRGPGHPFAPQFFNMVGPTLGISGGGTLMGAASNAFTKGPPLEERPELVPEDEIPEVPENPDDPSAPPTGGGTIETEETEEIETTEEESEDEDIRGGLQDIYKKLITLGALSDEPNAEADHLIEQFEGQRDKKLQDLNPNWEQQANELLKDFEEPEAPKEPTESDTKKQAAIDEIKRTNGGMPDFSAWSQQELETERDLLKDTEDRYESYLYNRILTELELREKNSEEPTGREVFVDYNTLSVDHKKFQGRIDKENQATIDDLKGKLERGEFDMTKFEAIRTWKDPETGKTLVISGHGRLGFTRWVDENWEELPEETRTKLEKQGYKRGKLPTIDMSHLSLDEARKFAKIESNRPGKAETELDVAHSMQQMREEGIDEATILEDYKGVANSAMSHRLSFLKQGGKTWDAIKILADSNLTKGEANRVLQIGEFIGEARRKWPELTDSHENELYDWLAKQDPKKGKAITTRNEFIARVERIVGDSFFNPKEPLNLDKIPTYGENETRIRGEIDELKKRQKELHKQISSATSQSQIEELRRELANVDKEVVRLNAEVKKAREADKNQGNLFDQKEEPTETTDKEKELTDLLDEFGETTTTTGEKQLKPLEQLKEELKRMKESLATTEGVRGKEDINREKRQRIQEWEDAIREQEGKETLDVEDTGQPEEPTEPKPEPTEIEKKLEKQKNELKDLLDEFGKPGDKLMTGVDPEKVALAGKIIAKATEIGITKFEQLIAWIRDNVGREWLEKNFKELKGAWGANILMDNPHNEDVSEIQNFTEDDIDSATFEADQPADVEESEEGGETEEVSRPDQREVGETDSDNEGRGEESSGDRGATSGGTTESGTTGGTGGPGVNGHNGNTDLNEDLGGKTKEQEIQDTDEGDIRPAQKPAGDFVIPSDFIPETTFKKVQRYNQNIDALELLVQLKEEGRKPTYEEQKILFKYAGWGGIAEIAGGQYQRFSTDSDRLRYEKAHEALKNLLGDKYEDAITNLKRSILTSFYTPPSVIRGIYEGLKEGGFKGGKILEPSAGTGHFLGAAPNSFSKSSYTAVEMEPVTSMILGYLYPSANVKNSAFQDASLPQGYFNGVISNIPFGNISVFDKDMRASKNPGRRGSTGKVHNYFFVKALDMAKEGGVVAFVTSTGFMDSNEARPVRQYINDNAHFLGALRLPNSTFKGMSGTEVVSDIVFLRKAGKDEKPNNGPWLNQGQPVFSGTSLAVNEYFDKHPENVLGTFEPGGFNERFGKTGIDVVNENIDLEKEIAQKSATFLKDKLKQEPPKETGASQEQYFERISNPDAVREGQIVVQSGKVGVRLGDQFIPIEGETHLDKKAVQKYIDIRDTLMKLLAAELKDADNKELLRGELNKIYDEFVEKYGRLGDKNNLKWIGEDIDHFTVVALEVYDEETKQFSHKADIFSKSTITPMKKIERVDTPKEALMVSLAELGTIDKERISGLLGKEWEEAREDLRGLIYEDPQGGWVDYEEYLSGNVRKKLKEAEAAAEIDSKYQENVDALKEVQPPWLPMSEIEYNLGARNVPTYMYEEFADWLFDTKGIVNVTYYEGRDTFTVKKDGWSSKELKEYAVSRRATGAKLLEFALKDSYPNYSRKEKDPATGKEITVPDQPAMDAARAIIDDIKDKWHTWRKQHASDEIVKEVETIHNEKVNNSIERSYDGSHLNLPGYAGPPLRDYQKNAVWMLLRNNGGIVDHQVGLGKTLVMIIAAMEMRRTGASNKPMIVAPKQTLPGTIKTARTAYPAAKILTPPEGSFSPKNLMATLSRIAVEDWDIIIISETNFKSIPPDPVIQEKELRRMIDNYVLDKMALEEEGDKKGVKKMEELINNFEVKVKELQANASKNAKAGLLHFGQTGVDHLFLDESHYYKNLPFSSHYNNVKGLGKKDGSARAINIHSAVRAVQSMRNADQGVTFLSGTTISNSLVEFYSLLSYLRPSKFEEMGIRNTFDSWASLFATPERELEWTLTEAKKQSRFRRFHNVPELVRLYREIADVRNDKNVEIDKPHLKGGGEMLTEITATPLMSKFTKRLVRYVKTGNFMELGIGYPKQFKEGKKPLDAALDGMKKAKNMVAIHYAKLASLDMRLIFPKAPYDPNTKIPIAAAKIADIYRRSQGHLGTQAVFLDLGVPKYKGALKANPKVFDAYSELFRILTEDYNIPAEEIDYIQRYANSQDKKAELFKRVNEGKVRIILGGSENLGTGTNIQERIVAMHHLDVPWTPDKMTQRNGRGERFGNWVAKNYYGNNVEAHVYGVKESMDRNIIGLIATKKAMIDQIREGSVTERVIVEKESDESDFTGMTPAQMAAALSGDPRIMEHSQLEEEIAVMGRQKANYDKEVYNKRRELAHVKDELPRVESNVERMSQDASWEENAKKSENGEILYEVVIGDKKYTKPKDAGAVIYQLGKEALASGKGGKIGTIFGYSINIDVLEEDRIGGKINKLNFNVQVNSGLKHTWGEAAFEHDNPEVTLGRFPLEALKKISDKVKMQESRRDKLAEEKKVLEEEIKKPWPKEEDYKDKKKRKLELDNVVAGLKVDDQETPEERDIDTDAYLSRAPRKGGKRRQPKDRGDKGGETEISKPIGSFEGRTPREQQEGEEAFKLFGAVIDIIRKYAPDSPLGQGSVARGSIGTFYPKGEHIRIKGMQMFSTAMHELAHALDHQVELIKNLIATTSPGDYVRQQLTDIYVQYYPGAKKDHKLSLRMIEGYAVLLQKQIEDPGRLKQQYPWLVENFIEEGGQYTIEKMQDVIADVENAIATYQGLDPIGKMGARIRDKREKPKGVKIFSRWQKLFNEIFDKFHLTEMMDRIAGKQWTAESFSLRLRSVFPFFSMSRNNIGGKNGYYNFDNDMNPVRKFDFNFRTIEVSVSKKPGGVERFGHWLYGRRIHFEFELRDWHWDQAAKAEEEKKLWEEKLVQLEKASKLVPDSETEKKARVLQQIQEAEDKIFQLDAKINYHNEQAERWDAVVQKEKVLQVEARQAYEQGHEIYAEEEAMFDKLVREDLLNLRKVGLLNKEQFDELWSRKGYVAFRREDYDDLLGETDTATMGSGTGIPKGANIFIRSLQQRVGSEQMIENPWISALKSHLDITTKVARQHAYNAIPMLADKIPGVFKREDYYPGIERKKDIVISRTSAGVRQAWKVEYPHVMDAITSAGSFQPNDAIFAGLHFATTMFKAGTTGLYVDFIFNNFPLDQFSAAVNSRNGFIPVVSGLKAMKPVMSTLTATTLQKIGAAVSIPDSEEAQLAMEYLIMGGKSHTYVYSDDPYLKQKERFESRHMDAAKKAWHLTKQVTSETAKGARDFMSAPGLVSELATRIAEYISSRKNGNPIIVALEDAARVSTPFSHYGRLKFKDDWNSLERWVKVYAYMNPAMQVIGQMIATGSTPDGRKRLAWMISTMMAMGMGSSLALLGLPSDDPRRRHIRQLSPKRMSGYMFFPNPFGTDLIRIRVPENYNVFATISNMALISANDSPNYKTEEWVDAATSWVPPQFDPTDGWGWAYSLVPTAFKGAIEVGMNKRSYPEFRDLEADYFEDQHIRPGERTTRFTSPLATRIGEIMMKHDKDRKWDMSPIKIDHLATSYIGRTWRYISGAVIPFDLKKAFIEKMLLEGTRQLNDYYEIKEVQEQEWAKMTAQQKLNKGNKWRRIEDIIKGTPTKASRRNVSTKEGKKATIAFSRRDNGVEDLWKEYRSVDVEQEPKRAQELIDLILYKITEIQKIYYAEDN